MKKISLLLSLMIAFSLTAQTDVMRKRVDNEKALTVVKKAQVQEGRQIQKAAYAPSSVTSLLNEGFNGSALPTGWTITDSDGDGFNWEVIDSLIIPSHSGSGAIFSASYDNTVGVLTPDNLLESPSIAVPSGAGTTLLEFYVAGVDNSYSAEYYDVLVRQGSNTPVVVFSETLANNIWKKNIINLSAYNGQSISIIFRHHNSSDEYMMRIDDISVFQTSDPIINPSDTEVEFISEVGASLCKKISVNSFNTTSSIQAQTAAPFEVSIDSITFSTTATLPTTGGDLYIRFTPTSGGLTNGSVTLSTTGATNVIVNVISFASDCSTKSSPYLETFGYDSESATCWDVIDGNNDGNSFIYAMLSEDGSELGYGYAYSETNSADEWLVSPVINVKSGDVVNVTYKAFYSEYPEKFSVWVVPETAATAADINANKVQLGATKTISNTTNFTDSYDISAHAGQNKRIAIHCESDPDMGIFAVPNFSVTNNTPVSVIDTEKGEEIIYPNPAKDMLYIASECSVVEVYSMTGQLVYSEKMVEGNNSISISHLETGVYAIRLVREDGNYSTQRFVKQ